jgi:polysaccharide chain length determinant protein (PEP-CTERM system associated)
MNDLISLIPRVLAELRSAWRFRWYGAAIAWGVCVFGWVLVALAPNVYEASATVYVDTSSFLKPILANQIVTPDVVAQLTYVHQSLLGRQHLEHVAHENGLDANVQTPTDLDRVLSRLLRGINIETRQAGGNSLNVTAKISYRNSDRDKALGVVTTVLNTLVQGTLGATREGTDTASQFVDERIAEYEIRLQEAEQALADFKKANADRLPGAEGGYFARIGAESTALESARRDLRLAQSKAAQLRAQLAGASPVSPGDLNVPLPPNSIDARIRDAQAKLDTLRLDFTDKHPDVIAQREVLRQLEAQRAEQLTALGVTKGDLELTGLGANPVYQALEIALNEADVDVATIQADVEERRQKVASLQLLVDEVPQVEAELARLNRDYDVVNAQYQALIRSRETQDLSEKASDTDSTEFRVINPPLADFEPVAPNRILYLAGVLFVGLGLGGILCWFLALTRPVFSTARTLQDTLGLPVLGVVTLALSARQRMQRAAAFGGFLATMGTLGLLFVVGVAIEVAGGGLENLLG